MTQVNDAKYELMNKAYMTKNKKVLNISGSDADDKSWITTSTHWAWSEGQLAKSPAHFQHLAQSW